MCTTTPLEFQPGDIVMVDIGTPPKASNSGKIYVVKKCSENKLVIDTSPFPHIRNSITFLDPPGRGRGNPFGVSEKKNIQGNISLVGLSLLVLGDKLEHFSGSKIPETLPLDINSNLFTDPSGSEGFECVATHLSPKEIGSCFDHEDPPVYVTKKLVQATAVAASSPTTTKLILDTVDDDMLIY
jgi:hypothetical protein